MIHVGLANYVNTLPFALYLNQIKEKRNYVLHRMPPAALNSMLKEGTIDVALCSSSEYLSNNYDALPFGLCADSQIKSVHLYLKKNDFSLEGKKIGLTDESSTSVLLLKVLCYRFWRVKPFFTPLNKEKNAAFLLIGDEALALQNLEGYYTIDLAAQWNLFTGLPFVFALFLARKNGKNLESFQQDLRDALEWSAKNKEEIVKVAMHKNALSSSLLKEYYSLFRYHIGEKEQKSLRLFGKYVSEIPT